MADRSHKRHGDDSPTPPKRVKTSHVGATSKMSFAERMLAKQGWTKGQSLGKTGTEGIKEAIQVKLRPQGVGLGSVKEMTPQARAEARRRAKQRGEDYGNSSDDDRARHSKTSSGSKAGRMQKRQQIATARQEFSMDALSVPDVPAVFRDLIDMTGAAPSQTDFSSLRLGDTFEERAFHGGVKLARAAQTELEAFDHAWQVLTQRREHLQAQQLQSADQLIALRTNADVLSALLQSIEVLAADNLELSTTVLKLAELQIYTEAIDIDVSDVAVGVLYPFVEGILSGWDPLEPHLDDEVTLLLAAIRRVRCLLSREHEDSEERATFSSVLVKLWLPIVRTAILNDWKVTRPEPLMSTLDSWKDVLPEYLSRHVVNFLVVQKLTSALEDWNAATTLSPHQWLIPWLTYLDPYHLDSHNSSSLLGIVRKKYRGIFSTWNPRKGLIKDLDHWLQLQHLRGGLRHDMDSRLLPKLAKYLSSLKLDPANQDLGALEDFQRWECYFRTEKFARPLVHCLFPQLLETLHAWLTSDVNYEAVAAWIGWWHDEALSPHLSLSESVQAQWDAVSVMIANALALGESAKTQLASPRTILSDASRTSRIDSFHPRSKPSEPAVEEKMDTKDLVEELCEREGLLLLPLRRAHDATGAPLFRITASAVGSSGVIVYFRGSTVWSQSKKEKDRWEPVDVFEPGALMRLAEVP